MANVRTEDKIIDKEKRAFLKYTGILDSDETGNVLIDTSQLAYALNNNNQIMTANTDRRDLYDVSIRRVYGSVEMQAGYLRLHWDGDDNTILVIRNGTFDYDGDSGGMPSVFVNDTPNTNGNILITTFGTTANDIYTLLFDLRKNTSHYDQGQTASPTSFNFGDSGIV